MNNTLQDLAVKWAVKSRTQVDQFLEDTTVLPMIPFEASTNPLSNVFEEITKVDAAQFVDLNEKLPNMSVDGKLQQEDLKVVGGLLEVGDDTAKNYGGAGNYFAKRIPVILRETGTKMEYNIIYDKLRKRAIDAGQTTAAGSSATTVLNSSIVFVRWVSGVTTGLYSEQGFGNGNAFEEIPVSNGSVYKNTDEKLVYGMYIKNYFNVQVADKRTVYAITGIDASNIPTAIEINNALSAMRAMPGNSMMIMRPEVANLLYATYKNEHIQMVPGDQDYNTVFTRWNGIPMVTTYNMDAVEA